jgi:hypothetical protein
MFGKMPLLGSYRQKTAIRFRDLMKRLQSFMLKQGKYYKGKVKHIQSIVFGATSFGRFQRHIFFG